MKPGFKIAEGSAGGSATFSGTALYEVYAGGFGVLGSEVRVNALRGVTTSSIDFGTRQRLVNKPSGWGFTPGGAQRWTGLKTVGYFPLHAVVACDLTGMFDFLVDRCGARGEGRAARARRSVGLRVRTGDERHDAGP